MADDLSTQTQDGSVDSAALSMPDIETLEREQAPANEAPPARERDESGKFKGKEAKAAEPDTAADDDDEDPFVEMPPDEDGKDPIRHKLSEVFAGFQKSKTLETELEKARTSARPMLPVEVEGAISEINNVRQNYIEAMEQWARMTRPEPPSLDLVNPNSPNYNPELFQQQIQEFQSKKLRLDEASKEIEAQKARQTRDQEALHNARLQREWARVKEIWPEFTKPEGAQKASEDLQRLYGFDEATIKSVIDSRFYALAKDALAFRNAKAKEADAVKVVKAKPKLVQANARSTATAKSRASADGLKRLQASGSIEDAAAALDGLF